jgi:hypothetical protein
MKLWWILLLTALLVTAVYFPIIYVYIENKNGSSNEEFFFGVSFGGDTVNQAKSLIDRIKGYTNFFLINNWDISTNETALNEISQYAIDANLNIMVYYDFIPYQTYPWIQTWLTTAKERWENKFLGVYLYDEPGGKQIDTGQWRSGDTAKKLFENVSDYSDAANRFTTAIPSGLSWQFAINNSLPLFTSDYALYWFDYLAGYDTVFVELGWNLSRPQHIALGRGAANVQGKDWGAIIVWTVRSEPALGSGPEILQDMITAYRAGAKYVVVFNFPYENPFGILEDEHFDAMKTFWEMTHSHQDSLEKVEVDIAFVLPKDYGWGMRGPGDNIWGVWPTDSNVLSIAYNMNKIIEKYGITFDIIYDDPQFNYLEKYSQIIYWNNTMIESLLEN